MLVNQPSKQDFFKAEEVSWDGEGDFDKHFSNNKWAKGTWRKFWVFFYLGTPKTAF